jgi:hypothetical protein
MTDKDDVVSLECDLAPWLVMFRRRNRLTVRLGWIHEEKRPICDPEEVTILNHKMDELSAMLTSVSSVETGRFVEDEALRHQA